MKKRYIIVVFLIISSVSYGFTQNIELPDLTTVITNESVKAGVDALPDFNDVMIISEKSGTLVPVLPDVDSPVDSDVNAMSSAENEKTIFAEGLIGGGYPSLFTGNFSVFRLSETSPFKISFSHDSAVGYGNHSLGDGYNDRTTSLMVERAFEKNNFNIQLDGEYQALANGLQGHAAGLTGLNQDIYSAGGKIKWNASNIFSMGLKTNIDFYNRYADIASGDFNSSSVMGFNPELFALWNINNFEIGLSAQYNLETDFAEQISEETGHRGQFELSLQWNNELLKAYGNVAAVIGNNLNDNKVVVPFTLGIDSAFPVYFSNRRFGITAEGGLDSHQNRIVDLEKKYKFSGLTEMPSETSDWFGKLNFSVPLKESFTGNAAFEYRHTAFNNGTWSPLYNSTDTASIVNGIYKYSASNMQQFISDFSITYHYGIFSITGGWHSNWLDVPVVTPVHQLTLDLNFQSEDSKWGADLNGFWDLDTDSTIPVINLEGFARLTSSVRAVVSVNDAIKLFMAEERVYAGNYISRSGTVTALLKFFF